MLVFVYLYLLEVAFKDKQRHFAALSDCAFVFVYLYLYISFLCVCIYYFGFFYVYLYLYIWFVYFLCINKFVFA